LLVELLNIVLNGRLIKQMLVGIW